MRYQKFLTLRLKRQLYRLSFALLPAIFFGTSLCAQIFTVEQCSGAPGVAPGSNVYGPMYSVATANATSRTAVIYPASQLASLAGQTINGIYFYRVTGSGAMAGTPSFKIYLKETTSTDWGDFSVTWTTAISGATLIYNSNPSAAVGTTFGWKNFVSGSNFVYSGNNNLAVMMEYVNTTASTAIQWAYEASGNCIDPDNFNTTKYINNTTGTPGTSLSSTNEERPYIGFDILASCYPPTSVAVPLASTTTSSGTVVWAAPAAAPAGGYEYYYSTSPVTPIPAVIPSGSVPAGTTNKNLTGLTAGTAYYVWVRSVCSGADKSIWTNRVMFNTVLTNDEASTAIPLSINSNLSCAITKSGITYGATQSADADPGCHPGGANDDVWYSFVATNGTHTISFSNVTSGIMAGVVYAGSLGGLAPLANGCVDPQFMYVSGLAVGQTYYIRAYTYEPETTVAASFSICIGTPPPPPANDECTNAVTVPVNPSTTCASFVTGTVLSATPSDGPFATCGNYEDDVWFKFVATKASHIININNINGNDIDMAFQVLSSCGTNTALICSDPNSAIVSGLTIGNTYYIRVATFSYVTAGNTTFEVCVSSPADMAYVSSTTIQASTATLTAGSINQQIVRVNVTVSGSVNPLSLTQLDFNTNGSTTAANIAAARVYYTGSSTTFTSDVQFGSTLNSPSGAFSVTGSQQLTGGVGNTINYFWLVYDLACNAAVSNIVDAECTGINVSGSKTPAVTAPAGTRTITAAVYSATVTQASAAIVLQGAGNAQILRVALAGCGNTAVTSISFTTNGSTNAATSILAAKVFYTTSTTFETTTQFGSTVPGPSGAFTVTGSLPLTANPGYFWLAYDISPTATVGNVVDATCTSSIINGITATPPAPNPSGSRTVTAPLINDDAAGAITLTVGSNCTGATYSITPATKSANEVFPSCAGTEAFTPLWFKFIAPASGAVRVSTDLGSGNTLTDTRVGLFSATNVNDYSSFSIISCDDNGGSVLGFGNMSVLYAAGLVAGNTYYIAVDKKFSTDIGTFCIAVHELSSSMLSSENCAGSYQSLSSFGSTNYTGWHSLSDGGSKLVAMVKGMAGVDADLFEFSQYIHSGVTRNSNGTYYLNRNFRISHPSAAGTEVKLFFLSAEMVALTASDAGVTLGNLAVTRQSNNTNICYANFSMANGSLEPLSQTANGSGSGVDWIGFTTTGFSNFYLHKLGTSLPVHLLYFNGKKSAAGNLLSWKANCVSTDVRFEIERSPDGRGFTSIGTISASMMRCLTAFDFIDNNNLPGVNYYRLKMIDIDGKISHSNIIAINNKPGSIEMIGLQPSPVQSETILYIAASKAGKLQISVTDMVGKQLQLMTITVSEGENKIKLNFSSLAAGVYNLVGLNESGKKTIRFVKQ